MSNGIAAYDLIVSGAGAAGSAAHDEARAGSAPNVEDLGLAAAGVLYGATGITTNATLRTTAEGVWAIGDCVAGAPRYTSLVDLHARIAVHNALDEAPPREAMNAVVPAAVFTDPELGRAGLTEAQARQVGHAVRAETVPMRDLAHAVIAGELLGEIALAVRLGLDCRAIADTLHAYPTFSEGVFWTAWALAKPEEPGQEATCGIEAPRGDVEALDEATTAG